MLMFGIVTGDEELGLPNFNVNTANDIRQLMYDVFLLKDYRDGPNGRSSFPGNLGANYMISTSFKLSSVQSCEVTAPSPTC